MTRRDIIIMMKKETPKRMALPNHRIFIARYRHVTRAYLPANIQLRWPYRQRAVPRGRRCGQIAVQQGHGFGSNILKFAKKPVVQELDKMALNKLPNLYNKGINKIKNKKIEKLLQSDLANLLVDMGIVIWTTKIRMKIIFLKILIF